MAKTYTLAVNVFNGGERFAKTLASIEKVHTLFDEVYISITETDKSHVDFKNCKKFKIHNLKIYKYNEPGCKNHFINTIKNLNTDFVLFLGHDDICHEDGIIEAKNSLETSDGSIAFYGSNFIQDKKMEALVLDQDKRAIYFYKLAITNLPDIDKKNQKPGLIMANIYYALLSKIISNQPSNILNQKISLSKFEKFQITLCTLFNVNLINN